MSAVELYIVLPHHLKFQAEHEVPLSDRIDLIWFVFVSDLSDVKIAFSTSSFFVLKPSRRDHVETCAFGCTVCSKHRGVNHVRQLVNVTTLGIHINISTRTAPSQENQTQRRLHSIDLNKA